MFVDVDMRTRWCVLYSMCVQGVKALRAAGLQLSHIPAVKNMHLLFELEPRTPEHFIQVNIKSVFYSYFGFRVCLL